MTTLSICIATYNRARFIGQTLQSILGQLPGDVELVVVDGNSSDDTAQVMAEVVARHSQVRYYRELVNSGVDADYDKAVGYANGAYCWLMTDDDLLNPGAIATVLAQLDGTRDLVIVNAQINTADLSRVLRDRLLPIAQDQHYGPGDQNALLAYTAGALSFIGSVVILRQFWLARDRAAYNGSLFVHVGVIFQSDPPTDVLVIAEPLIVIRYGNAMWTPRGFEIWMSKWPRLVWSFAGLSDEAKAAVCLREPWRQSRKLWLYRALGGYSRVEYHALFGSGIGGGAALFPFLTAVLPRRCANSLASVYCLLFARHARMNIYDLAHGASATWISRLVARAVGV